MLLLLLVLLVLSQSQGLVPSVNITNTAILREQEDSVVLFQGRLSSVYDDTTYNQLWNCKNGELQIINVTHGTGLSFSYAGMGTLTALDTSVSTWPNSSPLPSTGQFTPNSFRLQFNCPAVVSSSNFFNKVSLELRGQHSISFMLDCDPANRHKTFEYGYLVIAVLNAAILVGVAVNSYIWSLKFNGKRLKITLHWPHILAACLIGVVLAAALYFFAFKSFSAAFTTLRYVGIVVSIFFVFICFNELFYLFRALQRPLFLRKVRVCEVLSGACTAAVIVTALLAESWILYDFMAVCICVASIKLFHFTSIKEAFISKGIMLTTVTVVAVALHYFVPDRSYNDYVTELSSPLFLMVPDLDPNLYKKCSWLMVVDVIAPGVMLAFLRLYDENKDSKWGGVYTVWGNVTVILATILWVGLEAIYPFAVPFSLIVYLCLMAVIFLLAYKRNEWKDLYYGTFEKERSIVDESKFTQRQNSFSSLVGNDVLENLKRNTESKEDSSGQGSLRGSGLHEK